MRPLDVECPTCGVLAGRYCEWHRDYPHWPAQTSHPFRAYLANGLPQDWPDTLAVNILWGAALCEAFDRGANSEHARMGSAQDWQPGHALTARRREGE